MGFYDTDSKFEAEVRNDNGFYGPASSAPEPNEPPKTSLRFAWWEWAIISVEVGLVAYTVLVLLRIAPLF